MRFELAGNCVTLFEAAGALGRVKKMMDWIDSAMNAERVLHNLLGF